MKQKMTMILMMLGVSFGFALFGAQSASAATITVNSLSDAIAGDGQCTLREAMTNAEADDQSGSADCAAGAGADTIDISAAGTINLLTALPVITTDLTINGLGASQTTVRRDSNAATEFRIFRKISGNSIFSGMTVRDGVVRGVSGVNFGLALGGGIFNEGSGTMTLSNVVVTNNQAIASIANINEPGTGFAYGGGIANGNFVSSGSPLTIIDSTISGNIVTGGKRADGIGGGAGGGGGISTIDSPLTITNSTFSGNSATGGNGVFGWDGQGGAIYCQRAGAVTITNSVINGNTATGGTGTTNGGPALGGGIFTTDTTNLTINNSSVAGNSTVGGNGSLGIGHGGGINIQPGSVLSLNNSTVSGNLSSGNGNGGIGGGIINWGTAYITGSTVSNNTATRPFDSGGGIINRNAGSLNITNSTVSGNVVIGNYGFNNGGGILNRGGNTTLNNVTVTNNTAYGSDSASGVKRTGSNFPNSTGTILINVKNTIIAGNVDNATVPDIVTTGFYSGFVSQGYNLIGNAGAAASLFSQTGDQTGTSAAPLDPMLAALANNGGATQTHRLLTGSPAIDAGNSTLATDQRGFPRPVDIPSYPNAANGSDIGAFEYQGTTPTDIDQCKDGGWMTFDFPRTFINQGDCIQFVNTGR